MIPYMVILLIGAILLFVIPFIGTILGLVFFGYPPKIVTVIYSLSRLISISIVLYGAYGIIKHLFF